MSRRSQACAFLLLDLVARVYAQTTHQNPVALNKGATVLRQAGQLREQHKPEKAAALLRGYLGGHADDADALALLAQIQVDAGDSPGARDLLVKALNASPNSPSANRLAGSMLLAERLYPQAMDRFETVLAILPHDEEARRLELEAATKLAVQARTAGNEEAALKVLEHVREKMPDSPELLLDLGVQASDLHRYPEAEEALKAARQLNSNPDILYALARVELEQQHMQAAESDMRGYLIVRPNDASAHFGLGHILAMEQHDDASRAEFERSVQLQPVQTESYYQIGQLDLNAQQEQQAEALFRKVIERDPNHGGALVGLGEIAFHAKRYTEAEGYLQRAKKAAPDYAPAHYDLGLVLARLGQKAESDKELRLATQLGHDASLPTQAAPQP